MLTGQECERSRRQQALHCGHSGKSGQRGRRVATGLRGYGACEAAEGVVQKSGAKDESSRSGTLTFNGTHASERGAAARKVEWGPALREFENFVGSRFTPACNTSASPGAMPLIGSALSLVPPHSRPFEEAPDSSSTVCARASGRCSSFACNSAWAPTPGSPACAGPSCTPES